MIKLLDLFCGEGGAAMGYYRAAKKMNLEIQITGVDIVNHAKRYPFNFIQGDALEYLRTNQDQYTHVHASPPCQLFSTGTGQFRAQGYEYPDLLTPTKLVLYSLSVKSVIENVMPAPLRPDIVLAGQMFGLKVIRRRKFELVNWFAMRPGIPGVKRGAVHNGDFVSVFGKSRGHNSKSGKKITVPGRTIPDKWAYAMGIDWMTEKGMAQAIPPAYTELIGLEFFR